MRKIIKKILVFLLLPLSLLFVSCGFNFINENPLLPRDGINRNVDKDKGTDKKVETSAKDTSTLDSIKQPNKEKFKVSHVVDGDTVSVYLKNGKKQSIRLYGIDTPETLKPSNKDKLAPLENLYAQRAKEYLTNVVKNAGNEILLQKISEDRYQRVVGIIYTPDGTMINNDLVRNGQAMVWYITNNSKNRTYYTRTEFQKAFLKIILLAQQEARNEKLGFWKEPDLSKVYFQRTRTDY